MKEWEPTLTKEECNSGELGACYCGECEAISWSELAQLTHATQVERFNWCSCEDSQGQEKPYEDCPIDKEERE
jgi:hypothetical protein